MVAMNAGEENVKPLRGMRVLTLAVNVPGPAAAPRLQELGATVMKLEPPGGDPLAQAKPGLVPGPDMRAEGDPAKPQRDRRP